MVEGLASQFDFIQLHFFHSDIQDSQKYDTFHGKKAVLFINLLGKGLTQEINGDEGSIWRAPVYAKETGRNSSHFGPLARVHLLSFLPFPVWDFNISLSIKANIFQFWRITSWRQKRNTQAWRNILNVHPVAIIYWITSKVSVTKCVFLQKESRAVQYGVARCCGSVQVYCDCGTFWWSNR